ncbi:hypothetical protein ACVWZA_001327 [Sphingomonas sp. UYAg733]
MDGWEYLVQQYLCLDRRVFLNPQYQVGGADWYGRPDFLAIDFTNKTVWMIEVSTAKSSFSAKAAQFSTEYEPRIRSQLVEMGFDLKAWTIRIWFFTSEQYEKWARGLLAKEGLDYARLTTLETVTSGLLNGSAWQDRSDQVLNRSGPESTI